MKITSYLNPYSKEFNSFQDFKKLTLREKITTIVLTIFATLLTLPLLGVGGMLTFRALVRKFSTTKGIDLPKNTPFLDWFVGSSLETSYKEKYLDSIEQFVKDYNRSSGYTVKVGEQKIERKGNSFFDGIKEKYLDFLKNQPVPISEILKNRKELELFQKLAKEGVTFEFNDESGFELLPVEILDTLVIQDSDLKAFPEGTTKFTLKTLLRMKFAEIMILLSQTITAEILINSRNKDQSKNIFPTQLDGLIPDGNNTHQNYVFSPDLESLSVNLTIPYKNEEEIVSKQLEATLHIPSLHNAKKNTLKLVASAADYKEPQ